MKFEGSIEYETLTIVWRKLKCHHNDAITIQSLWNSNANLQRVNFIYIPKLILIGHKRAEIQSREVNKEFWRKMDITSLSTIWFEPEQQATILQKNKSKCVHLFGFTLIDRQTLMKVVERFFYKRSWFFKRKSDSCRCRPMSSVWLTKLFKWKIIIVIAWITFAPPNFMCLSLCVCVFFYGLCCIFSLVSILN